MYKRPIQVSHQHMFFLSRALLRNGMKCNFSVVKKFLFLAFQPFDSKILLQDAAEKAPHVFVPQSHVLLYSILNSILLIYELRRFYITVRLPSDPAQRYFHFAQHRLLSWRHLWYDFVASALLQFYSTRQLTEPGCQQLTNSVKCNPILIYPAREYNKRWEQRC